MNILEEIKKEHYEIEKYFLQMENDEEKASEIFKKLAVFLLSHHESEENTVYNKLSGKKETKETKGEIIAEHDAIRRAIQVVMDTPQKDDKWKYNCHVLKDLSKHHIEEEENEMFKVLRKEFDEEELKKLHPEFEKYFAEIEPEMKRQVKNMMVIKEGDEIPSPEENTGK